MFELKPAVSFVLAWIGNCGFWLFCFNRVNAFGYARPIAKALEKICIGLCFAIPLTLCWLNRDLLVGWLHSPNWWPETSSASFSFWLAWSLLSIVLLGPLWLESRRWIIPPKQLLQSTTELHDVHRLIPGGSAQNLSTRCLSLVPLNEFALLSVTQKTLELPRPIPAADGLTIGHISDLHFTGQYRTEHYHFVVERMMELQADLLVISGDIIDYAKCLPMIQSVLSPLKAPLGVHFVLGNHDRRLKNVPSLLERLTELGFQDLGVQDHCLTHGELSIHLTGNERPWFERHVTQTGTQDEPVDSASGQTLRVGVSHSPDQIGWARSRQLDLMLAGHTHGGQARFPLIGPLVAPSLYGSKFASGVFFLPPTIMHVSRGVAGTHPLRWRCPPEISLLTLRSPTPS